MVRHAKLDRIDMHFFDLQLVPGLTLRFRTAVGHHMPALGLAGQDLPVLGDAITLLHGFLRLQLWHNVFLFPVILSSPAERWGSPGLLMKRAPLLFSLRERSWSNRA